MTREVARERVVVSRSIRYGHAPNDGAEVLQRRLLLSLSVKDEDLPISSYRERVSLPMVALWDAREQPAGAERGSAASP